MIKIDKKKVVKLPIADIKITFYVRKSVDEDRVCTLAELYESGVDVDPIEITANRELVDGRHRINALELLNITEINCVFVKANNRVELMARAFEANLGGALPPSQKDIDHTIRCLIEEGVSTKKIIELFPFPAKMVRKHVSAVRSELSRLKVNRAINKVADGEITTKQAAEEFDIPLKTLQNAMQGKKKKKKAGVAARKGTITSAYKSISQKNFRIMQAITQDVESGELSPIHAVELASHLKQLISRLSKRFNEHNERLDAVIARVDAE